jgi:hypothetical protein
MLGALPTSESTPPLYYVLAWIWSRMLGTDETGLRSLSAAIGTLTVLATYAGAQALVSRRSALFAAALVVVSPFLVWYSARLPSTRYPPGPYVQDRSPSRAAESAGEAFDPTAGARD